MYWSQSSTPAGSVRNRIRTAGLAGGATFLRRTRVRFLHPRLSLDNSEFNYFRAFLTERTRARFLRNWDLTVVGSNPTERLVARSSVVEHQDKTAGSLPSHVAISNIPIYDRPWDYGATSDLCIGS